MKLLAWVLVIVSLELRTAAESYLLNNWFISFYLRLEPNYNKLLPLLTPGPISFLAAGMSMPGNPVLMSIGMGYLMPML